MDEVLAYHEAAMDELGFVGGAGMLGIVSSAEIYSCAWHGESEVARLSFMAVDEAVERYPEVAESGADFTTLYRWLIVDRARTLEPRDCPPPP